MVNLYAEGQTALSLRDAELVRLRSELAALKDQDLPNSLAAEILAQAPDIASVEVAHRKRLNQAGVTSLVPWIDVQMALKDSTDSVRMVEVEQQLGAWLLLRLETDTLSLHFHDETP